MAWEFNDREALFLQIARHLGSEILCGKYPPDTQMPTVRQIAAEAAVNPNTVQKALAHLESEGILYTRGTIGRFVTGDTAVLSAAKERVRREAVQGWLREANALGISEDELIQYIKEEDKS